MFPTRPDRDILQETLKAMARQDTGRGVSRDVEAHLRRHVQALKTTRSRFRLVWLAAAALLLVAIGLARFTTEEREPLGDEPSVVLMAPTSDGFLPLPNAQVPMADAHVVRMPVARASLAWFGLDPGAPGTPEVVLADVLVGHDSIARSVRFLGPATNEELTR